MEKITRIIYIRVSKKDAFDKFVNQLNEWWPKEYTWSQDKLVEIRITPGHNGLCTEIGPHNFRCDWGRVVDFNEHNRIALKWQISPQRVPEPDPDKASDIAISFREKETVETTLELEHTNFQNHGDGAEDYQKAMDSEYGWDYILKRYVAFCEE